MEISWQKKGDRKRFSFFSLMFSNFAILKIGKENVSKICGHYPLKIYGISKFARYTESVKFRSQSRETASKRKPYRGLGTRYPST